MKKKLLYGLTTAIIALLLTGVFTSCDLDKDEKEKEKEQQQQQPGLTISGSFQDLDNDIDAKFYASQITSSPSASIRSALSTGETVDLEGLIEDGDFTIRLRGSYDAASGRYLLSAAGTTLRYSISGNLNNSEPDTAIVQAKTLGGDWISIEIEATATSTGTPPVIEEVGVEDEINNGIPQDMWGMWWGQDAISFSEFDIIQPGNYYYVVDAYTVVLYINRQGTWGVEGFTCFFDGIEESSGTFAGKVVFDFTDTAKIDQDEPTWWIDWIDEYAISKGSATLLPEDWGNPTWQAKVDSWAALANADPVNNTGKKWWDLFGEHPYFYQKYRRDGFKWVGGNLQIGRSDPKDSAVEVSDSDPLTWDNNLLSRAQTAPAVTYDNTFANGFLQVPSELGGWLYSTYQSKNNVIKIPSNAHWGAIIYDLTRFGGQTIQITASVDVMVSEPSMIMWQINNGAGLDISEMEFPVILGDGSERAANTWHTLTVTNEAITLKGFDNALYLSEMQLKGGDSYNPNKAVDVYIANFSISITGGNGNEVAVSGPHAAYAPYTPPSPDNYYALTSSKGYNIVNLDGRQNAMKVVNPDGSTEWAAAILNLDTYLDHIQNASKEITIEFGVSVKRTGAAGDLNWQINNSNYPVIANVNNAKLNTWYYMTGEWTGTPNAASGPALFLSTNNNNSPSTTYYIANFWVSVTCTACDEATWECACDPGSGGDVYHDLGATYTWDTEDSIRGWVINETIRAKIADGSITNLVLGLDAASVQADGGLGSIGIFLNAAEIGDDKHHVEAFPWYWDQNAPPETTGWISYEDLSEYLNDGKIWLDYNLTNHPEYTAFKTAMGTAEWAQIGLYVHNAWLGDASWPIVISVATLKETGE